MRQPLEQRVDRVAELPFWRRRECVGPDAGTLRNRNAAEVDFLTAPRGERRVDAQHSGDAVGVEISSRDAKLDVESVDVAASRRPAPRIGHTEPLAVAASRARSRTCDK